MDKALSQERCASGDGEPGTLGQGEEQAGGLDLQRSKRRWGHLSHRVSANGVNQWLPFASQLGREDKVWP